MNAVDDQFIDIVDDIVIRSQRDPDLAEGVKWIDEHAHERGVNFYEMAMAVLRKYMAEKKAKQWFLDRK